MSPDIRKHRGPHPDDRRLFAEKQLPALRAAVVDLSWLLTHGYTMKSALKLVGDRHGLTDRQRLAVSRASCADASKERRARTQITVEQLNNTAVIIDGFNLIITIEAALSDGVLLLGRDGCIRDLSSVHGSYRSVNETVRAVELIGASLASGKVKSVLWLLDRPISNSGRLASLLRELAEQHEWPWRVETTFNPDREIISSRDIVISSDGPLLDRVDKWMNLSRHVIEKILAAPWLIDLS